MNICELVGARCRFGTFGAGLACGNVRFGTLDLYFMRLWTADWALIAPSLLWLEPSLPPHSNLKSLAIWSNTCAMANLFLSSITVDLPFSSLDLKPTHSDASSLIVTFVITDCVDPLQQPNLFQYNPQSAALAASQAPNPLSALYGSLCCHRYCLNLPYWSAQLQERCKNGLWSYRG